MILTISICTRDRVDLFTKCLKRLADQGIPYDEVEIDIRDNSKNVSTSNEKLSIAKKYLKKFNFHRHVDLISCRKVSASNAKGEFFLILDDDDYLEPGCMPKLIEFLKSHKDNDFISIGVLKSERDNKFDGTIIPIKDKPGMLNSFDSYKEDMYNKVYLSNTSNIYRRDLLKKSLPWEYLGCDDIIPITSMYIKSLSPIRWNECIYRYDKANTIVSGDTINTLWMEIAILKSYKELSERFKSESSRNIISKSIRNSIGQLTWIQGLNPVKLTKFLNGYIKY